MPGRRNNLLADYMTPWKRVRANVFSVDEVGPESDDIPLLSTSGGPNDSVVTQSTDSNYYGRNAQINFCVVMVGFASVALELWLLVEESVAGLPAIEAPPTGMWILVEAKTFTASGFWVVKDIPPGKFKVRVAETPGAASSSSSSSSSQNFVSILESHAA